MTDRIRIFNLVAITGIILFCCFVGVDYIWGEQVWMSENLRYASKDSYYNPKFAAKEKKQKNKYGRLYTWDNALQVCPAGWHLPSDEELSTLKKQVTSNGSTPLKSEIGWSKFEKESTNGTNEIGFAALPTGYYIPEDDKYYDLGKVANFWSSTMYETDYPLAYFLYHDEPTINRSESHRSDARSVRCLLD